MEDGVVVDEKFNICHRNYLLEIGTKFNGNLEREEWNLCNIHHCQRTITFDVLN